MDMSLIQGTITGFTLIRNITKSFLDLKATSEIQAKVIELQDAILSTQNSALAANAHQAAMVEEIRNLKEEIARIKAWEEEKQRYKLVSPWQGTMLYTLKKESSLTEPPHWICANCYENGRKSILNTQKKHIDYVLVCPACKFEFHTHQRGWPPPTPAYANE